MALIFKQSIVNLSITYAKQFNLPIETLSQRIYLFYGFSLERETHRLSLIKYKITSKEIKFFQQIVQINLKEIAKKTTIVATKDPDRDC